MSSGLDLCCSLDVISSLVAMTSAVFIFVFAFRSIIMAIGWFAMLFLARRCGWMFED